VGDYDMECLLKATGGKLVRDVNDLTPEKLGYAELVEERKIGEIKWIVFEGCKKPKSLTILIRGATPMILDMSLSSMGDALFAVRDVMRDPRIVAGGGAPEMEIAMQLKKWALQLPSREQLAALSFAEALEAIPSKIAENCGMDALSTIVELRARHAKGEVWSGIDALNGKIEDMMKIGVLDPVAVKEQVIKSACEAAAGILKIDEIIGIKREKG
jgi:chaperonin GroEL (HSP60 family)